MLDRAAQAIEGVVVATRRAVRDLRSTAEASGGGPSEGAAAGREELVAELAGTLADRTDRLRTEAEELSRLLARARRQLGGIQPQAGGGEETAMSETSAARGRGAEEGPGRWPNGLSPSQVPEGARLLATQMVAAGSTREEIEERLRREFGVVDAHAVLTKVLGSAR